MQQSVINRITINPNQCGGKPCVRGMRIRVTDVLELIAGGLTSAQVIAELPDLEKDDVSACLKYAAAKINHPVLHAASLYKTAYI